MRLLDFSVSGKGACGFFPEFNIPRPLFDAGLQFLQPGIGLAAGSIEFQDLRIDLFAQPMLVIDQFARFQVCGDGFLLLRCFLTDAGDTHPGTAGEFRIVIPCQFHQILKMLNGLLVQKVVFIDARNAPVDLCIKLAFLQNGIELSGCLFDVAFFLLRKERSGQGLTCAHLVFRIGSDIR